MFDYLRRVKQPGLKLGILPTLAYQNYRCASPDFMFWGFKIWTPEPHTFESSEPRGGCDTALGYSPSALVLNSCLIFRRAEFTCAYNWTPAFFSSLIMCHNIFSLATKLLEEHNCNECIKFYHKTMSECTWPPQAFGNTGFFFFFFTLTHSYLLLKYKP